METRSNHILVGGVVLAIIAVAVAFLIWMSQVGNGHQHDYDIFFPNSVDGLAPRADCRWTRGPGHSRREREILCGRYVEHSILP